MLRKEVALLVKKMDMFYLQLFEFEKRYLHKSNDLTLCLIERLIKPIKKQTQEVYKQLLFLNSAFKD
ncbi:hypothetical protein ARAF_3028 [Arsenophonus endosymbiont of Aleurodicus floccissimus]|uniref:hypothetical protein n=1 Tax=Arsenophonus endosymbiont of Aleurodicus floccissimus TaxID=2152761 RepID=UPI000E6B42F9|nr:hypothetical protein [Arsenophonus endosymbiont of Aleurodicus floccissimus]SPP32661.1 hypothetical protein ARAF_3028 [Arsenophonus endosymbiont of Aleurodicus floccissimus]